MANIFDQFDAPGKSANPFDRFDRPVKPRNPRGHDVPEYVPPGVEGYNPETGEIDRTGIADKGIAFTRGVVEGVPVLGPVLMRGAESAAAAGRSLRTGEGYDEARAGIHAADMDTMHDNPGTTLAGNVAGAVAGTLPLVTAAPWAFGAGAAPLLARMGISGLTGGGIGVTDAAVRSGGDIDSMRTAGLIGLGTGLAGPMAGRAIGSIWNYFRNFRPAAAAAGVSPGTLAHLSRAVGNDGMDAAALQSRLAELGPDALPLDAGPNLQRLAGGLAAQPGEAQQILRSAVAARDAGANARILSGLDDALGPAGIPSRIDASIRANQRALSPQYQAVLSNAKAVDTQPIANSLDSLAVNLKGGAQSAVQNVRRMLNVNGTDQLDPYPGALLAVRQEIDDMMEGAAGNMRRILGDVRKQVDDTLASSVPGIKDVDAQFAELARQRSALENGGQIFDGGKTAVHPSELARQIEEGARPQGRMVGPSAVPLRLREGARAEIDRIVGTNANDRAALQRLIKGDGDWNPAKLAQLFGRDKAERILGLLERERVFAETSGIVTRNSETAARQAVQQELNGMGGAGQFGVQDAYKAGGLSGAARAAGLSGTQKIIKLLVDSGRRAEQSGLARLLSANNHADIVKALARAQAGSPSRAEVERLAKALVFSGGGRLPRGRDAGSIQQTSR